MVRFGAKLKELRKEKQITLREMARRLKLAPAYISRIENGKENPPMAKHISKMANILGIDADMLFKLVPSSLQHNRLPGEIIDGYQKNNVHKKKVPEFFRSVNESNLTENDWDEIIKHIKKKGKPKHGSSVSNE